MFFFLSFFFNIPHFNFFDSLAPPSWSCKLSGFFWCFTNADNQLKQRLVVVVVGGEAPYYGYRVLTEKWRNALIHSFMHHDFTFILLEPFSECDSFIRCFYNPVFPASASSSRSHVPFHSITGRSIGLIDPHCVTHAYSIQLPFHSQCSCCLL